MMTVGEMNSLACAQKAQGFQTTIKETPLTRLAGAVERLRRAEEKVQGVTGALVGETIAADGSREAKPPIGSGMLGNIEELADAVSDLASDIIEHANRIERRL